MSGYDDMGLTSGSWLTIRPASKLFSTFGRGELPTRFVTYNFFPHITYKPIYRNFPLDCSNFQIQLCNISFSATICLPQYQVISFYHIGQAVPVKSEASAVRRNDPQTGFGASDVCESWSTGIEATSTSFHGLQGIVQELSRWVTSRPIIHLFDICVCSYVSVWFMSC